MLRNTGFFILLILMINTICTTSVLAYDDSFSCSYGKKAACLDYNDKVCSSSAKCVSSDAICFDSYTCDYNGFICKTKFNNLVDEYEDLSNSCRIIAANHDDLVSEHDDLLYNYRNSVSEYEDLQSCISYASTLAEAKSCY